MNIWYVLALLLSGAMIALVLVAIGIYVANYFGDMAYKRYQQGVTDGWRAREVRTDMHKTAKKSEVK